MPLNLQSAFTKLLFSTVRISATHHDGSCSVGTAFYFTFKVDEQRVLPCLITNKHVVAGARSATFWVHTSALDSLGAPTPAGSHSVTISRDFEHAWVMHPNADIDLCAMPFEPIRRQLEVEGKTVFTCPLDDSLIPSAEVLNGLSAMEELVMAGYPIGLWDSTNNLPILRRGTTACHPGTDFQGQKIGLVDMACFPGSSGSPILVLNEGAYTTANGLSVGTRIILIGILYAGPQYCPDGSVQVVQVPTRSVAVASTSIPVHLGYYVKSAELLTLKEVFLRGIGQ
jgi:hypothetical protein